MPKCCNEPSTNRPNSKHETLKRIGIMLGQRRRRLANAQHYADIASITRVSRDTKRHKPPVGVVRLGQSAQIQ